MVERAVFDWHRVNSLQRLSEALNCNWHGHVFQCLVRWLTLQFGNQDIGNPVIFFATDHLWNWQSIANPIDTLAFS